MDCLFCSIIKGGIPSKKAYEDELCYAFYDIAPQAEIHILVIPKLHIASADGITAENIFECIPKIAADAGIKNGYRVVTNCGSDACQSVKHLHFHVLGGEQLSEKMA